MRRQDYPLDPVTVAHQVNHSEACPPPYIGNVGVVSNRLTQLRVARRSPGIEADRINRIGKCAAAQINDAWLEAAEQFINPGIGIVLAHQPRRQQHLAAQVLTGLNLLQRLQQYRGRGYQQRTDQAETHSDEHDLARIIVWQCQ